MMSDEETASQFAHLVEDLPSVKKLRSEISGLRLLAEMSGNAEAQESAKRVSAELDRIAFIVGEFYRILGRRHWVFFDSLNLERAHEIISKTSSEEAERALICYLKEEGTLKAMLTRLNRFPDMRPRMDLLRKAERDYLEGRYYSSVFTTVSMMDGFVNDVFKSERRGLHAREADEMRAEDCVAAVWNGLPSVQREFTKSVHKRIDDPIVEVYRHALMHGMATNFDNDVIASKAWCMLFAVADWAEAKSKPKEEPKDPDEFKHALAALLDSKRENAELQQRMDTWNRHFVNFDNPAEGDVEILESCRSFFDAWKSKNYGRLGALFPNYTGSSIGAQAGEARQYYSAYPITRYELVEIDRPAPATAQVKARIDSAADGWSASIRFVRLNGDKPAAEWEPGEWKVMHYATAPFRSAEDTVDQKRG